MLVNKNNVLIEGCANLPILIDYFYINDKKKKPLVIFSHGFKGFKDWGPFNQMSHFFSKSGFIFIKFNFSHNGTTLSNPNEFKNLSAFGNNNFSKELDDLSLVINWALSSNCFSENIDNNLIYLVGHSRGGAISMLKSNEDDRVSKVVSWASPSNLLRSLPKGDKLEKWRESNVAYIYNSRTKQNMPIYFQFYKDCIENTERMDIQKAVSNTNIPQLIVHGTDDHTVLIDDADLIGSWKKSIKIHKITMSDHVFGAYHPFNDDDEMPSDFKQAIDITIKFLKDKSC